MRVAIATVQVPFIYGGAEIMCRGLFEALRSAGHQPEIVTIPFRFGPAEAVLRNMELWCDQDFTRFDCGPIDQFIALKFPAYYAQHSHKKIWLTHQHRSVYELYDTQFGDKSDNEESRGLRQAIKEKDTSVLSAAENVFTISKTVSRRLLENNGVHSTPLYQPPLAESEYTNGETYPYIFFPSRLEALKRQDLLVQAMRHVNSPVIALIAGEGSNRGQLISLIESLGVNQKVKLLGKIDHKTMLQYYKNSLSVFFAPLMEDYGLVTLEAMLSGKPVITCLDSGGPTEFVVDGSTGYVLEPIPEVIGRAIDSLWSDKSLAKDMGENGRVRYHSLGISWMNVVENLLK